MPRTPQLTLSLSPEGLLQTELPGAFATRRKLPLQGDPATVLCTIRTILEALGNDRTEIGQDGAPTEAQVRHWERHCGEGFQAQGDTRCRFCLEEGRFGAPAQHRTIRKPLVYRTTEGVEVRRIAARTSGLGPQVSRVEKKTAEELGL